MQTATMYQSPFPTLRPLLPQPYNDLDMKKMRHLPLISMNQL